MKLSFELSIELTFVELVGPCTSVSGIIWYAPGTLTMNTQNSVVRTRTITNVV